MSFTDKTLACADCQVAFVFSAAEQEFYSKKGFTNEPKRCPSCRTAKKQRLGGGTGQRQMFPAVCAQCGVETQVPFEPRTGRPVYCSDCYSRNKPAAN